MIHIIGRRALRERPQREFGQEVSADRAAAILASGNNGIFEGEVYPCALIGELS